MSNMWAKDGDRAMIGEAVVNEMNENKTIMKEVVIRADARDDLGHPLHYRILNKLVKDAIRSGATIIKIKGVLGQRYIGATASNPNLIIQIEGTPGNNLGALLNGSTIEVFGNAQDVTGNTMNSGRIIIHGNAGDVTGLSARGGRILIRDSVGYRTGIHMKEFKGKGPCIVIGGRAGDYLGEYMAGGTIVVLGKDIRDRPVVGQHIAAGMHGGRIFIRGKISPNQLAPGAVVGRIEAEDKEIINDLIEDYERSFDVKVKAQLDEFIKIIPADSRPFRGHYDKRMI